jgi:hypothetical protein
MVTDGSDGGGYTAPDINPVGPGGGLHPRLRSPRSVFKPLPGVSGRQLRLKYPRARQRQPKAPHERPAPKPKKPKPASHAGGHTAHATGGTKAGQTQSAQHHRASGAVKIPAGHILINAEYIVDLIDPFTGDRMTQVGGMLIRGHHPKADGKLPLSATPHAARQHRAQILSVSGSTATVRFGDTPDSPVYTVNVSPAIAGSVLASATMAGVALWSDSDPSDMLITTVA